MIEGLIVLATFIVLMIIFSIPRILCEVFNIHLGQMIGVWKDGYNTFATCSLCGKDVKRIGDRWK